MIITWLSYSVVYLVDKCEPGLHKLLTIVVVSFENISSTTDGSNYPLSCLFNEKILKGNRIFQRRKQYFADRMINSIHTQTALWIITGDCEASRCWPCSNVGPTVPFGLPSLVSFITSSSTVESTQ